MHHRARAREVAFQLLCQHDCNPGVSREAIERFVAERIHPPDTERYCAMFILLAPPMLAEWRYGMTIRLYCLSLYDGVLAHREALDQRLTEAAENWRLPRMAATDRNILRLGAYELLFGQQEINVAITESIELARRFGSQDSPAFINGVLDRIAKQGSAGSGSAAAGSESPSSEGA
jgi:N utilization substance protein B